MTTSTLIQIGNNRDKVFYYSYIIYMYYVSNVKVLKKKIKIKIRKLEILRNLMGKSQLKRDTWQEYWRCEGTV